MEQKDLQQMATLPAVFLQTEPGLPYHPPALRELASHSLKQPSNALFIYKPNHKVNPFHIFSPTHVSQHLKVWYQYVRSGGKGMSKSQQRCLMPLCNG